MKLRTNDKLVRMASFLVAVRFPHIYAQLAPYGLTHAIIDQGWQRHSVLGGQMFVLPSSQEANGALPAIDDFENRWFPIAKITLDQHYPQISKILFGSLGQTQGKAVVGSVSLFLQALDAMETGQEPFGAEGPNARKLLTERGLTPEIVEAVTVLLAEVKQNELVVPDDTSAQRALAERQAAEDAMWAWYREWSQIARRVIQNGHHLRALGFRKRKATRAEENSGEELVVAGHLVQTAAPAATAPLALNPRPQENAA